MPRKQKAVHVAIIRREYKGRTYESVLLRRTYREDGKVKHETLGNLSHLPPQTIDLVRRSLQGETFVTLDDTFEIQRSWSHGHVVAVVESLRACGLSHLIHSKSNRRRSLVEAMIVNRILEPGSKFACAQSLSEETASTTLGQVLELESVNEDELYQAMDWLLSRQEHIEQKLAERHLADGALVLYDVTSSYFEGRTCPLARLGHSRDGRRDRPQIVIGLLCDRRGCPVAVEVFEGNTADPKTVSSQVRKLCTKYGLRNVVVVGDRGMLTDARIREDLKPEGLHWISSLRAPAVRGLVADGALQLSLFEETDLAEIAHPDFPGERLVVCRNPILAEERARKRAELLACTERDLEKVNDAIRRQRQPLRGKENIALRVGRVLNRFKMAKHFILEIEDDSFTYRRNVAGIDEEAALDGIYVIRTDLTAEQLSAEETVSRYKDLAYAERAFRSMKTVDLRIRPIFHRLADRVRAHVLICMLAYYVEWHMRQKLAPILFDDHDKPSGRARRRSIVSSAQRSEEAWEKARTKRTADDEPVQSFQRLLRSLASLTRSTVAFNNTTFTKCSTPTKIQKKAFDLLGVKP